MAIWDVFKPKPGVAPVLQTLSPAGVKFIQHHESCELQAYPDPLSPLGQACLKAGYRMRAYHRIPNWDKLDGGPWTIGWGNTAPWVKEGTKITQQEADDIFRRRIETEFVPGVRVAIKNRQLKQHQFDALVSLAYNIGVHAFATSTTAREAAAGQLDAAGDAILLWSKNRELVPRREAEQTLFVNGTYE